jgi:CxxC motif-containing protein
MGKKEMTCIVCPIGCHVEIWKEDGEFVVTGNQCPRGKTYATKELTNPTRLIPTTVVIVCAKLPRLPVKTSDPVPKEDIFKIMELINKAKVEAPVTVGDVIIEDVFGLGINIVATRSMKKAK